MKIFKGESQIKGNNKVFCIVVSRFNEFISKNLLAGCISQLKRCAVREKDIMIAWVPGAFEIPLVAQKMANKRNVAAVICLGAIVRGETKHFELVARGTAGGISRVSLESGKPVIFEVLATESLDQAYKRSEIKGHNKGQDAALAAVEMVNLLRKI